MADKTEKYSRLATLYGKLYGLLSDKEKNSSLINQIYSEIQSLNSEINDLAAKEIKDKLDKGFIYSEKFGIWIEGNKIKEANDLYEKVKTKRKEDLSDWEREQIQKYERMDITGGQWYNNFQIPRLTGQKKCPSGPNELSNFISESGLPISFVYLKENPTDPKYNHFVTFSINEKREVTYIDSNGELMSVVDRDAIAKAFGEGNFSIKYRNYKGEEIPEEHAKANPEEIIRMQFNNGSCGMHAAQNCMLIKNGSEEYIQKELVRIRDINIDPIKRDLYEKQTRAEHQKCLNLGLSLQEAKGAKALGGDIAYKPGTFVAMVDHEKSRIVNSNIDGEGIENGKKTYARMAAAARTSSNHTHTPG